jgi:hypothetical protein
MCNCAKPKPVERVEVYDIVSSRRLLGTIEKPSCDIRGPRLEVAFYAPRSAYPLSCEEAIGYCNRLSFTVDYRITPDGWRKEAILMTDAPLKLLMQHEGFRLPGETEQQAKLRKQWS